MSGLAGPALPITAGIENMVRFGICGFPEAIQMASVVFRHSGSIRPLADRHASFGNRVQFVLDVVGTIIMLSIPALTSNVWLVGIAMFIGGFGGGTWNVAVNSIRQSVIPNELLGRVYAGYRFVGWGTLSLGAILAGLIAERWGVRSVFAIGAVLNVSLFIPLVKVLTNKNLNSQSDVNAKS